MDNLFKQLANSQPMIKLPIIIAIALFMAWFTALLFPSKMGAEIFGGTVADMYETNMARHKIFHPEENSR